MTDDSDGTPSNPFADAKTRAETAKIYSDIAQANADLEAKRIANEKARSDIETERIDKLVSQVTAAIPDLSSLKASTVTFSQGKALRQGEATATALQVAAKEIAAAVRAALPTVQAGSAKGRLYLTSNANLLQAVVGYRRLRAEAAHLQKQLTDAVAGVDKVNPLDGGLPAGVDAELIVPAGVAAAGAAAAVAGKAVTEVASLFEVTVDVATSESGLPALSVHAAVIAELLDRTQSQPDVEIVHELLRAPGENSKLLLAVASLIDSVTDAAVSTAMIDAAVARFGDVNKDLAAAQGALTKAGAEGPAREKARKKVDEILERWASLKPYLDAQTKLSVAIANAKAFVELATASSGSSPNAFASAVAVEPFAAVDSQAYVLVLGAGQAESSQLMVTRRIFAPRFQTSVNVRVDFFLIHGELLAAAGHASGSASFHGKITRYGATWKDAAAPELVGHA